MHGQLQEKHILSVILMVSPYRILVLGNSGSSTTGLAYLAA